MHYTGAPQSFGALENEHNLLFQRDLLTGIDSAAHARLFTNPTGSVLGEQDGFTSRRIEDD